MIYLLMVLYSYYNCTSIYLFNYIVHCKYLRMLILSIYNEIKDRLKIKKKSFFYTCHMAIICVIICDVFSKMKESGGCIPDVEIGQSRIPVR